MYDFRVFDEPQDLDDPYDDEPEEGEARCEECGYVMPAELIEHIDDVYLGWCRPCIEGR